MKIEKCGKKYTYDTMYYKYAVTIKQEELKCPCFYFEMIKCFLDGISKSTYKISDGTSYLAYRLRAIILLSNKVFGSAKFFLIQMDRYL